MVEEDFVFDFVQIIEEKSLGIDKSLIRESMLDLFLKYSVAKKQEPNSFLSNNSEIIAQYFSAMRLNGLSEKTIKNYKYHFNRFLSFINKPLIKTSTNDIRLFLANLTDCGKNSPTSVGGG